MLAQSVLDIHHRSLVIDAHFDLIFDVVQEMKKGHKDALDQHVIQLDSGGVAGCITTVWADGSYWRRNAEQHAKEPTLTALQQLSEIKNVLRSNSRFTEVSSAKEILEAKKNGKIAIMYHLEGGLPLGGVLERL